MKIPPGQINKKKPIGMYYSDQQSTNSCIQGYMAGPGLTVAPSIDTSSLVDATLK